MEALTLTPSLTDLIASLKSAFDDSDFSGAERILFSWAESLKSELSKTVSDELLLLEVEKCELQFEISRRGKELDLVKKENVRLQEKFSALLETIEELKKRVVFESINGGGLEIRVFNMENELQLVKQDSISLREEVRALSKIAEGSQRQRGFEEKHDKGEDCFANTTPIKRAFRAPCSDSESGSEDNLPIGDVFNTRIEEENKVVKTVGSRKRRLIRPGQIEDRRVLGNPVTGNINVGNEPGRETEVGGSCFPTNPDASSNKRYKIDDFSDTEDYMGCKMNESDCSGSPVVRKLGSGRARKLNCSDTEEEKDEIEGSESTDQVYEGGSADNQPTEKVAPDNIFINLDYSGSEEEIDTESDSEGDSLGGFIVSESEIESDDPRPHFSEEESYSENDATLGDLLKKIKREKRNSGKKWEFEAEMLADFGKSPELCLNAVCALHRQQTEEEQQIKCTVVLNGRGFSQVDASRYVLLQISLAVK
jgi:hypothetical protein